MSTLGRVVDVTVDTDKRRVFVDVALSPNREASDVKFRQPGKDIWVVPETGDVVEVDTIGRDEKVALSPSTPSSVGLPSGLSEGDVAIRLDSDTLLYMQKSSGDVTLTCSGDLNLDAANIYVGDSSNSKKVATEDHIHTDSSGGDTSKPDDVTSNEME